MSAVAPGSALSNACNFALDFQQGEGHTQETFPQLVKKYGGGKVNSTTLSFPDGSSAEWVEEERSWKIVD